MKTPNTTPTYRGYAYPHIYITYFSMYKIAQKYPSLVTYLQFKTTYLLRAYNIFKALYDGYGVGKNATLNGTTSWVAGHSNNAVSLNGTNAYASIPTGIISSLNNFTISTWVKLNSISNWVRIFDFGNGTTSNMFLTPQAGGAGLRFAIMTGGNCLIASY